MTLSWERSLDELEAHLAEAEALLRSPRPVEPTPWQPPALGPLGPLPAELAERARALAERQSAVLDRLPIVLESVGRQRRVTDRFGRATGRARGSVYVDRTA